VADIIVLAKYAEQIAVGKKNSSGTAPPYQRLFLAKMWRIT
jgi:hypothetical protein